MADDEDAESPTPAAAAAAVVIVAPQIGRSRFTRTLKFQATWFPEQGPA